MKFCVKNVLKIVLFSALMAGTVSCADFRKVSVRDAEFEYFTPSGLRSASWSVKVGVNNGTRQFTISDVEGKVYGSGKLVGTITAADVVVERGVAEYSVRGDVALDKSVSIMDILSLVTSFSVDDYTADLTFKVKPKGGSAQKIKLKNLPVKDLAGSLKNIDI